MHEDIKQRLMATTGAVAVGEGKDGPLIISVLKGALRTVSTLVPGWVGGVRVRIVEVDDIPRIPIQLVLPPR